MAGPSALLSSARVLQTGDSRLPATARRGEAQGAPLLSSRALGTEGARARLLCGGGGMRKGGSASGEPAVPERQRIWRFSSDGGENTGENSRRRGREDSEEHGTAKRLRSMSRGEDDYLPGNILSIELRNFMTYDYIQAVPGPRLNLVIGPNGTGKSSLVCAICIGLAGEPKLLGRATNIGDYVQRGHEKGRIKITLRGQSQHEHIEIIREITTNNKTEWIVDGKPSRKEDVKQLIHTFNIQVGNLTQFLPQDKVCEFAKLSSTELLVETEKAVGDPELHQQHMSLIEKQDSLSILETTVKQHEETLHHLKTENSNLEKDVERMQKRGELLKKAKIMKMKEPWLKYEKVKVEYLEIQEQAKEAKNEISEAHAQFLASQAPFLKAKDKLFAAIAEVSKINAELTSQKEYRTKLTAEEDELASRVQTVESEIESLDRQAGEHQSKIRRAKQQYEAVLEELNNYVVPEAPIASQESMDQELNNLRDAADDMENKKRSLRHAIGTKAEELKRCRDRLNEAESLKSRVLQALVNEGNDTKLQDALNWLKENRGMLKEQVFGPVAIEVHIPDSQHAQFLENHVPRWAWQAFITTCEEDRDLLAKNVEANVVNYKAQGKHNSRSITDEERALGVTHTLDQVFEAHEIVKSMLCSTSALEKSFIGTAVAERNAQALADLGIPDLWTPAVHFRWSRSDYHNYKIGISHAVRQCRIFSRGIAAEEIAQIQRLGAQLDQELREMDEEIKSLSAQLSEKQLTIRKLEDERLNLSRKFAAAKKGIKELEAKVERMKNMVENLQNANDPTLAQDKLRNVIKSLNLQRVKKTLGMQRQLVDIGNKQKQLALAELAKVEFAAKVGELEGLYKLKEEEFKARQKRCEEFEVEYARLKQELRRALDEGNKVVDLRNRPDVQELFKTIPDTLEDLQAAIREVVEEANAILCRNPQVVEEYERRQTQINDLEEKLDAERSDLEKIRVDIESIKSAWLHRLRGLVRTIDEAFSRNFAQMAVAGEVSLEEHDSDFANYGILIKVKFREAGQLQILSAQHQSGGERSVATILYLVALQAITHCPFRVVDEINQGMDPSNERKMFQQLVRAASLPNTPQCFLLTPKLLSDLDYGTACTVLNIMNGPYISPVADSTFKIGTPLMSAIEALCATSAD